MQSKVLFVDFTCFVKFRFIFLQIVSITVRLVMPIMPQYLLPARLTLEIAFFTILKILKSDVGGKFFTENVS